MDQNLIYPFTPTKIGDQSSKRGILSVKHWIPTFVGMVGVMISGCNSTGYDFDKVSAYIYKMDLKNVSLTKEIYTNTINKIAISADLTENGYIDIVCVDDSFDQCFVQYFEGNGKTGEFTVALRFNEYDDLVTATGNMSWDFIR